ncbi:MAG: peptide-methionine (S)-S-oxide reductase MsrA [Elusimicrobiota bacterium]
MKNSRWLVLVLFLSGLLNAQSNEKIEQATFAGGCFWCMETPFEGLPGVQSVISGFSGGEEVNPTYQKVSDGLTSHAEVVQITYDSSKISYKKLLDVFWRNIDPTQVDGQFVDIGKQYRTAIFTHHKLQMKEALESKHELEKLKKFSKPIVTDIVPYVSFYPAEEYHQDFYKKNPVRYKSYRYGSGRDQFVERIWGKK